MIASAIRCPWPVCIAVIAALGGFSTAPANGQVSCDSLYYLLQNMAVSHVAGNESWVDHFIDCPGTPDTLGGFILSEVTQKGAKDRAVLARYLDRAGWQYKFGERARNLRFAKPTPRVDVDGDGTPDLVFTVADDAFPDQRGYRILFARSGTFENPRSLHLPRAVIIDSILPAPPGQAHPLVVADRRGWEVGGLRPPRAPVSYRYLAWDRTLDPPGYADKTAAHANLFPDMQRRAAYLHSLPGAGELRFASAEEYEEFLSNLVGYMCDQSNLGKEAEGYDRVRQLLDRVRYAGSTRRLESPADVREGLKRAIPSLRSLDSGKK